MNNYMEKHQLIIAHCFFGLMTEEEDDEHDNIHKTAHKTCGLECP